jgi:hypothetical protein
MQVAHGARRDRERDRGAGADVLYTRAAARPRAAPSGSIAPVPPTTSASPAEETASAAALRAVIRSRPRTTAAIATIAGNV